MIASSSNCCRNVATQGTPICRTAALGMAGTCGAGGETDTKAGQGTVGRMTSSRTGEFLEKGAGEGYNRHIFRKSEYKIW